MNIVVLGGSGFIGSRLVSELLAAGHRVRIFDRRASVLHPDRVTFGDVRDLDAVTAALAGCDCAIGLAAEHADDVRPVSLYRDVNVGGAANLVRAAAAQQVQRLLFVSSVSVYGLAQPLASESSPLRPSHPYGHSKVEAEAIHARWAEADPEHRSLVIVRPCVVFGEGNRGNVHALIDHIRRRRFVMIGDGRNRKSIAYVGNLVDFLCRSIHAPPGIHCYNYADKPDLDTGTLVAEIRALLPGHRPTRARLPYALALAIGYGFDLLSRWRARPASISSARVRKFCADTSVAADAAFATGFRPRVTLREGLARTIARVIADDD
jgi:nucleoside-diphosphate-sugar epimerase